LLNAISIFSATLVCFINVLRCKEGIQILYCILTVALLLRRYFHICCFLFEYIWVTKTEVFCILSWIALTLVKQCVCWRSSELPCIPSIRCFGASKHLIDRIDRTKNNIYENTASIIQRLWEYNTIFEFPLYASEY
jgi:hypothetical protein